MECGDKSLQKKYKTITGSYSLRTVVSLLKDKHSVHLTERQIILIETFLDATPCGYCVEDIPIVTQLIELLIVHIEIVPEFVPYFIRLLHLLNTPPLLHRFTQILEVQRDIEEYFSFFGYTLVTLKKFDYQLLIINALRNNLIRPKDCPTCCISLQNCYEAIEKSSLPAILCEYILMTEDNIYPQIIEIMCHLAENSRVVCELWLQEGGLETIMMRLLENWREIDIIQPQYDLEYKSDLIIEEPLKLLSILLSSLSTMDKSARESVPVPRVSALWGLKFVLRLLVANNRKIERNFVMSMILKFFYEMPDALLMQSSLVTDICILFSAIDLPAGGTWAAAVKYTVDKHDFDFKKMLLLGLIYCNRKIGAVNVFNHWNVIGILLKLVTIKSSTMEKHLLSEYSCKLRELALIVLERIIENFVDTFIEMRGIELMLELVSAYTEKEYDIKNLICCLKCLYKLFHCTFAVIPTNETNLDFDMKPKLRDIIAASMQCNIKPQLIALFYHILNNQDLKMANQCALTICIAILTSLVPAETFQNDDIELCNNFFQRVLHPRPLDIRIDDRLLINIINLLWELALVSDDYLRYFVESKAVYALIDIIKDSSFCVRNVALGFLVDACEEGSIVPYFVTWQNNGMCLMKLLLTIFREENLMLDVPMKERGVIDNCDCPIMGRMQRKQMLVENNPESPAITDMKLSCRPKIYALLKLLTERHTKKVEIANEYYKIFGSDLSIDDKITKLVCDHYLIFKLGEAWMEVQKYLIDTKLDIVYFDETLLNTLLKHYHKWGKDIQNMQNKWLRIEYKNEHYTEEEFYNLLRESKLSTALKSLDEMRFIARCTIPTFKQRLSQVESISSFNTPHTHLTFNTDSSIFSNVRQRISIQSDIIVNPGKVEAPSMVSIDNDSSLSSMSNSEISLDFDVDINAADSDLPDD